MRILLSIVVVAAAAASLVLWLAQRRWHAATMDLEHALGAAAAPGSIPAYSEAELEGLPAPVARYFRAVLRDSQPIVKRARITWEGEFNLGKPGRDKWGAFTAQQLVVPGAPGFVWNARMAMAPGMPLPAEAVTEWQFPTGAYQYWRGKLVSIAFDDASP